MKKVSILLLIMVLSGFVFAGSSSQINMTLIVVAPPVVDSFSEGSAFVDAWNAVGDYVVIALVVFVIFILWVKGNRVYRRRGKKKK